MDGDGPLGVQQALSLSLSLSLGRPWLPLEGFFDTSLVGERVMRFSCEML